MISVIIILINQLNTLSESTVVLYVGMAQKKWLPLHSVPIIIIIINRVFSTEKQNKIACK